MIQNTFDPNSEEVILPSMVYERSSITLETMIITFSYKVIDYLKENDLIKPLDDVCRSVSGQQPIYLLKDYPGIGVFKTVPGAATTVCFLEELAHIVNAKKFILFGSCGVLDNNLVAGKIIVPDYAIRDEGTSYHYAKAQEEIKIKNAGFISQIFTKHHIDHVVGKTWTTDAIYRETKDLVRKRKEEGCVCVEMEVSAVQAMCDFRNYEFYPFIYSADNLDASDWDIRILGTEGMNAYADYFSVALSLAKALNR